MLSSSSVKDEISLFFHVRDLQEKDGRGAHTTALLGADPAGQEAGVSVVLNPTARSQAWLHICICI